MWLFGQVAIHHEPSSLACASAVQVTSARELLATIEKGQQRRHVSSTQMNRESSRSHLIMSVIIEATNLQTQNVTKGKLSFVDLAGSERCGFTQSLATADEVPAADYSAMSHVYRSVRCRRPWQQIQGSSISENMTISGPAEQAAMYHETHTANFVLLTQETWLGRMKHRLLLGENMV